MLEGAFRNVGKNISLAGWWTGLFKRVSPESKFSLSDDTGIFQKFGNDPVELVPIRGKIIVAAGEFDKTGAGCQPLQLAAVLGRHRGVAAAVKEQDRLLVCSQYLAVVEYIPDKNAGNQKTTCKWPG
jgi:hypothetical protein